MKISVIAEFGGELSFEYISLALKENIDIESIIFIGYEIDDHRRKLVSERTLGNYKFIDLIEALDQSIIPCYFTDDVNSQLTEKTLSHLAPELVISGSTKIIRNPIWEIPKYGMLNCHSGFVQKYRGCSAVEWAILNDDPVGSSCHLMNEKIDAGELVSQDYLYIKNGDSYEIVRAKMIKHQAIVMMNGVKKIIQKPFDFSEEFDLGKYYRPMKDEDLINQVKSRLINKAYSYYEMKNSLKVKL
mgnify:CR=1 FL=1|tara:strand:- start:1719 stop:2450 length:732 start_codon:yes stop_codon:yes gene_type:complete